MLTPSQGARKRHKGSCEYRRSLSGKLYLEAGGRGEKRGKNYLLRKFWSSVSYWPAVSRLFYLVLQGLIPKSPISGLVIQ
jgi:hypothetical protein